MVESELELLLERLLSTVSIRLRRLFGMHVVGVVAMAEGADPPSLLAILAIFELLFLLLLLDGDEVIEVTTDGDGVKFGFGLLLVL